MVCQPIYCVGVIPIEKEGKIPQKNIGHSYCHFRKLSLVIDLY